MNRSYQWAESSKKDMSPKHRQIECRQTVSEKITLHDLEAKLSKINNEMAILNDIKDLLETNINDLKIALPELRLK